MLAPSMLLHPTSRREVALGLFRSEGESANYGMAAIGVIALLAAIRLLP